MNPGPFVGVSPVCRQVPVGQRRISRRSQFVGDFGSFEKGDRLGNRPQFGEQIAESQTPAAVSVVGFHPCRQRLLQLFGTVERQKQFVFEQFPASVVRFRQQPSVDELQHSLDERRVGVRARRQIGQRREIAMGEDPIESFCKVVAVCGVINFGTCGPRSDKCREGFPAFVGDRGEIALRLDVEIEAFDIEPLRERTFVLRDFLFQSVGKPLPRQVAIARLSSSSVRCGSAVRCARFWQGPPGSAPTAHGVGQPVQAGDLHDEPLGGFFGVESRSSRAKASSSIGADHACADQRVEQLHWHTPAIHRWALGQLQPQKDQQARRADATRKAPAPATIANWMPYFGVGLGRPTGARAWAIAVPGLDRNGRVVVHHPIDELAEPFGREPGDVGRQELGRFRRGPAGTRRSTESGQCPTI